MAPLTNEDCGIWLMVTYTLYSRSGPIKREAESFKPGCDRRDAALMLEARQEAEWGPGPIELHGIACRGWNSQAYWIEDTDDGEGVWMRD